MEGPGCRRDVLALGGLMVFASALPHLACAGSPDAVQAPPTTARPRPSDPRWTALGSALYAPSSHNSQPWVVHLPDAERIDFYVDPARKLPQADPLGRQLLISQGTFVETCSIALEHAGHHVTLEAVPLGSVDAVRLGREPAYRLRFESGGGGGAGVLFSAISTRHTNKRAYASRVIPASDLKSIAQVTRVEDCHLELVTDAARRQRIATLCRQAMAVDVSDRQRNEEMAAWFRFDDDELRQRQDGFGIGQSGVTGFNKWMAESFFLSRQKAADPSGSFAKKSVELTWKQASSASAFGVLTTSGNAPQHQLRAGRAFVRAQLGAEALGIRTQPLTQLVLDYPAMAPLRRELEQELGIEPGRTIQMLFRLGYAKPTPRSPRRPIQSLVRGGAP